MERIEEEFQDVRKMCLPEIHHVQNLFSRTYLRILGWGTLICIKIRDEISSTGQVCHQTKKCANAAP